VISFRNTRLLKRGVWISSLMLFLFVGLPSVVDGSLVRDPAPTLVALALLSGFVGYFMWKLQFLRLADEVRDCGDHLEVHRGRAVERVPMAEVAGVLPPAMSGTQEITVRLTRPNSLGRQFVFLPQASLWSNAPAVRRLVGHLNDRALAARAPTATSVRHE
jgi:hypothetical protein